MNEQIKNTIIKEQIKNIIEKSHNKELIAKKISEITELLRINYKQIIDDAFYKVHQSLGYFMIGYKINEETGIISIYNTDDTFNLDKTKLICEYDYFRDELRLHKDIDIELAAYIVNDIFYKIQKEIRHIARYLVEKVDK